jgi:hypothetical protein
MLTEAFIFSIYLSCIFSFETDARAGPLGQPSQRNQISVLKFAFRPGLNSTKCGFFNECDIGIIDLVTFAVQMGAIVLELTQKWWYHVEHRIPLVSV